jgi:hypothetical protein
MTRGILVAGNESSLFSSIAAEAKKRVESFASAPISNRFPLPASGPQPELEPVEGAIALSWNPASPLSARTLVLAAENRLGQLNDAILVSAPPALFRTAGTLTPEEIEILVNDHIKGWFFLIRELALYFRRVGAGSLSFVAPEIYSDGGGRSAHADLTGPPAAAAFRAFVQGVLSSSLYEPFNVMGFTGFENGTNEEFASWLFKAIDEGSKKKSGRWHKFSKFPFLR